MLIVIFLPILLPLFVAVFFLLLFTQKGQIFFVQLRPGYRGKLFKIYKFKTLQDTEGTEEERATVVGQFLRKTNLDELPQILNILKGEMSWVGPRPLLTEYLQYYNDYQQKRHNVLPGITGIAQLQLPKDASFTEKANLDIYYAENVSLWLDLKIILQTFQYFFGKKRFF